MEVKVYQVKSRTMNVDDAVVKAYFEGIEKEVGGRLELVELQDFLQQDLRIVYVATGGSEDSFLEVYPQLQDKPVYILTSGMANSLAASMEILSYLQQRGQKGEILHGDASSVGRRILALNKAMQAKKALTGLRMGLVGASSDWLIASSYDAKAYHTKLDAQVVEIPMQELLDEIAKGGYPANEWTIKLKEIGYNPAEVEKALEVYGALKRLVEKYKLGAVTVRCFDLLPTVKTTGCLALAILNAEGVYAGCEGDVPSLMSMCILGAVSGKPVFMCNPSRIDTAAGRMVLAHCTLPVNMPYAMSLTTHFESGIGVAIAGSIPEGTCTVFKASGDLSRHFSMAGAIDKNMRDAHLCRSQIEITLPDFSYFTKNPINNHHLVCVGDETMALQEFFALLA